MPAGGVRPARIASPSSPSVHERTGCDGRTQPADWVTVVTDWLPVAVAAPVVIVAVPLEVFEAVPVAVEVPPDPIWTCVTSAPFTEALPTAVLPPLDAWASPMFSTSALWWTTLTEPAPPPDIPDAVWLAVVAASALVGYMAPPSELGLTWDPERFGV